MTDTRVKHPLGYYLDDPLPYRLTEDDLGHKGKKVEELVDVPEDRMLLNLATIFTNFLNDPDNKGSSCKRAQLDEHIFVTSWLPHLYHGTDVSDSEFSIAKGWVTHIAGNVYSPVDIIREGKVIYVVPPMLGRMNIISGGDRLEPVAGLVKKANEMISRLPTSKEAQTNHIIKQMQIPVDDEHKAAFETRKNLKYLYVLDEIFTYYGYASILTPEIMSIKSAVMGVPDNGITTSGPVQNTTPSGTESIDTDDDLFG
nr:MAG TPA: hypothetical protein [Caudoviricetes sp.]